MSLSHPPNILFIVADQLRARSVGCYGDAQARTPHIDRLASQGIRFNAAYSTYPVCTPARASIHSGLMPTANHVVWNNQTLEPKYPCLAEYLSEKGYGTAFIGKWHLGGYDGPQGDDYQLPIKRTHRHGWNDVFKVIHGEDYRPGNTPTIIGDECSLRFNEWQSTWISDQSIEFLKTQDDDRPWILNLNYSNPHEPYFMPEKYKKLFDPDKMTFPPNVPNPETYRKELADYYGLTAWLDDEIGRVLDALEKFKGTRETLIVFVADHGWNLGSHNLPAKFSLYEESACVPLIFAGAGVPEGKTCDEPVSLVDLMPTFLDFGGTKPEKKVDGISLRSLLSGGEWQRKSVMFQVIDHPKHNMERWDPPSRGVRSKRYKYIERRDRKLLFDMQQDPYEMKNLADQKKYAKVMEEHGRELQNWLSRTNDPWPESAMQGVYYNVKNNPFGEFQLHIEKVAS